MQNQRVLEGEGHLSLPLAGSLTPEATAFANIPRPPSRTKPRPTPDSSAASPFLSNLWGGGLLPRPFPGLDFPACTSGGLTQAPSGSSSIGPLNQTRPHWIAKELSEGNPQLPRLPLSPRGSQRLERSRQGGREVGSQLSPLPPPSLRLPPSLHPSLFSLLACLAWGSGPATGRHGPRSQRLPRGWGSVSRCGGRWTQGE